MFLINLREESNMAIDPNALENKIMDETVLLNDRYTRCLGKAMIIPDGVSAAGQVGDKAIGLTQTIANSARTAAMVT